MNDKPFSIFAAFEAVRQAANRVRLPCPVELPGNLGTGGPLLIALIERRERDDQAVIVIEVSHTPGIINGSQQYCQ